MTIKIKDLIEALQNNDSTIRISAAEALGKMGEEAKAAVPALIAALNDTETSSKASEALSQIGSDAVPSLIIALKDPNEKIRQLAAISLRTMGSKAQAAISDLITALKDGDAKVRRFSAEALGEIGSSAVPALIEALKDQEILRDVAYALGRIEPYKQEIIINVLTEVMNNISNDLDVRWMAAAGLEQNEVDVESFLTNNSLNSPRQESYNCVEKYWGDLPLDDYSESHEVYSFDIYTSKCVFRGKTSGGGCFLLPPDIVGEVKKIIEEKIFGR